MSMTSEEKSEEHGERIVPMRLQRFLARAGAASRRGAENLMTAGRVRVNGVVVSELGSKVDPARDRVTVDGIEVRLAERPAFVMLNKPAGYLTTMKDPQRRPCVASLVPLRRYPGLFPVGRLDRDTTGILLFTTDGQAAQELLHPSKHVRKHYVALVEGVPSAQELARLGRGVILDDGPTQPAEAKVLGPSDALYRAVAHEGEGARGDTSVVGIWLAEGRKHQVKRMLAAIGHKVLRLHRDTFGPLVLSNCEEGRWRLLTDEEVAAVQRTIAG